MAAKIVLASSSIYRKELLSRIINNFECISPDIDEKQVQDESAKEMALRLSVEKARKVAELVDENTFVIGCDQTAFTDNVLLQKPINFENAFKQLKFLSSKKVNFYSAFCLLNNKDKSVISDFSEFTVNYRSLKDDEIKNYLKADKPFNCVGSIKSESLGITLLENIFNDDPSAIIGLPLIKLSKILKQNNLI
jgi:septum formation protein